MKYILYWEFPPEDIEKAIMQFHQLMELQATGAKDFPKALSPTYGFPGQTKGFTLYEVENDEQLNNFWLHFELMDMEWVPISEVAEFAALYMTKKK